jgi:hypothetical protein
MRAATARASSAICLHKVAEYGAAMPCFRVGSPRKRNHDHRNYRGVTVTELASCRRLGGIRAIRSRVRAHRRNDDRGNGPPVPDGRRQRSDGAAARQLYTQCRMETIRFRELDRCERWPRRNHFLFTDKVHRAPTIDGFFRTGPHHRTRSGSGRPWTQGRQPNLDTAGG